MDKSLLQRVAAGDVDAVEQSIQRYGDLIWSLAIRYCGDRAEVEGAVTEVFKELWASAAGRHDPRTASETSFVAAIARRKLMNRRAKRHRGPAEDRGARPKGQCLPFDEQGEVSRVAAILEAMKPEQRQVIELSLCEGYSRRDITDRLRLSPGAVKAHLTRGLMAVGGGPQL